MPDLHISPRLRKALPSLKPEEKQQLTQNIESDGKVTDPILYAQLDGDNYIVDGMHRYEIAEPAGIPYKTVKAPPSVGSTIEEAEIWILDRALGQRNLLAPADVRKLRGQLYNRLKRQDEGHGNQPFAGRKSLQDKEKKIGRNNVPPDLIEDAKTAAETVAEKAGVTERTVRKDGAYVKALESCTPAVQKLVENDYAEPTHAEMKSIAKLEQTAQNALAREVRTGKRLSKALASHKPKRGGGGKQKPSAAALVDQAIKQHCSPLAKLLSKIAELNGGEGAQFSRANDGLNELFRGLEEMRKGKC